MKTISIISLHLFSITFAIAQEETKPSPFSINGYLETYYSYDFNKPENNARPSFVYSHNRHNEVNLNLGFIRGSYDTDNVRANLALMTGTYANANAGDWGGYYCDNHFPTGFQITDRLTKEANE